MTERCPQDVPVILSLSQTIQKVAASSLLESLLRKVLQRAQGSAAAEACSAEHVCAWVVVRVQGGAGHARAVPAGRDGAAHPARAAHDPGRGVLQGGHHHRRRPGHLLTP